MPNRSSKSSDNASQSLDRPGTSNRLSQRMLQFFGGQGASSDRGFAQTEAPLEAPKGLDAMPASELGHWELTLGDLTAQRNLRHDQIFGYDSLLPRWTYEVFLEHVVPEDRPLVEESFAETIAKKGHWDLECRIRRADGAVRWIRSEANVQENDYGQGVRIQGLVGDITEQKRAEEG